MTKPLLVAGASWLLVLALAGPAAADWPQWGGPNRDFQVPEAKLAAQWPAVGPEQLWSRELGEGYSAVVAVDGRLFTMYRLRDDEEIVAAFAAADGEVLWQHRYAAVPPATMRLGYGKGPHSTPLVTAGRVFTAGTTAVLSALDAVSGELLWRRDLWQDLGGSLLLRGYASSPIAYGETVIVTVGEAGHALVAFAQADGREVWRAGDFTGSQASSILIEVGGREQLVAFVSDAVLGLDPATGEVLWTHPHPAGLSYNISTPLWGRSDRRLFLSSAYGGGSRTLRLGMEDGETTVEELWESSRMKVHFTNAIRIDGHVYAASGGSGGAILTAVDVATGEVAWKTRSVRRSNLLRLAGSRALILEVEGRLLLADLTPAGLEIRAETRLFDGRSFTVPTLVGRHLYVRDRQRLLALELPSEVEAPGSEPRG